MAVKYFLYGVAFMITLAACASSSPRAEPEVFPPADKYIALTFDDGPLTRTGLLLDTLRENGVTATFFLVGENINRRPDSVRRIIAEGHEIGNHSNDHAYLGRNSKLDENGIRQNITLAAEAVYNTAGIYPVYFRAPYFDYSSVLTTVVKELGMPFIGANVNSNDWENGITTETIVNNVLNAARDGGIILMHEHYNGDVERTIRAIPVIVLELRRQGYEILSVGELAQKKGVNFEAGKRYDSLN